MHFLYSPNLFVGFRTFSIKKLIIIILFYVGKAAVFVDTQSVTRYLQFTFYTDQ